MKLMSKHFILIISALGIVIIALVGLGRYSLLDAEYLFGWGRFKSFPTEIRQKHVTTIEKVDLLIRKDNMDSIISSSKKFNLENYLGIIEIGVLPYLKDSDTLKQDTQLLAEDIRKYIIKNKDRMLLE